MFANIYLTEQFLKFFIVDNCILTDWFFRSKPLIFKYSLYKNVGGVYFEVTSLSYKLFNYYIT